MSLIGYFHATAGNNCQILWVYLKPIYTISAERSNLTSYPLRLRDHLPLTTTLTTLDQLPSGLVAQLVEQRWFVPLHLRVHLPLTAILIIHDQLPSGLVAQLVEQWWSVSKGCGFESHWGQRFFSLSPCGPISFLDLSAQKVIFKIFIQTKSSSASLKPVTRTRRFIY